MVILRSFSWLMYLDSAFDEELPFIVIFLVLVLYLFSAVHAVWSPPYGEQMSRMKTHTMMLVLKPLMCDVACSRGALVTLATRTFQKQEELRSISSACWRCFHTPIGTRYSIDHCLYPVLTIWKLNPLPSDDGIRVSSSACEISIRAFDLNQESLSSSRSVHIPLLLFYVRSSEASQFVCSICLIIDRYDGS